MLIRTVLKKFLLKLLAQSSVNKFFSRNSIFNVFNILKGWSPVQRIYVGEKYSDNAEKAFVSGNNGIGMPYGTRLSLEKPCCKARMR